MVKYTPEIMSHLLMVNESILSFTFLQRPIKNGRQPLKEEMLLRLGLGPRPFSLGILLGHLGRLVVTGLGLLQGPDSLATVVLGKGRLALENIARGGAIGVRAASCPAPSTVKF